MAKYDFNNIDQWPAALRYFIYALTCAIVIYLGYFFDISNLTKQLNTIKKQEQDLKQQFEILFNQQSILETDIADLPMLQQTLTMWQKKLIKKGDLPELLNEILKIGTANGLQFNLFNPEAEVKDGIYNRVPIKVVVAGGYNQIATFVSQTANLPWIVVIQNFKLSKQPNSDSVLCELILEVYYLGKQ